MAKKEPKLAQPNALLICRNKHWRYISSFHGPWLSLPLEVLQGIADNNYHLSRPRPFDPSVLYDLVKIRRLVDEATTLSVIAASGIATLPGASLPSARDTLFGTGGQGLGQGGGRGGGGNAKLSKERKHRMREKATQKLSKAYHLDEVACSVAIMQASSVLEDVAQYVLQRNPWDADAKYVHYFHEKIPSRQLADHTPLQPLDEIIADRPSEAEVLRTRAVTRIFKDDYTGAAHDLTLALQVCRYYQGLHKVSRQKVRLASDASNEAQRNNNRWRDGIVTDEEDHPSSTESQLLFHRAGVYLTIASKRVNAALSSDSKTLSSTIQAVNGSNEAVEVRHVEDFVQAIVEETPAQREADRKQIEARKDVKMNAKRALRDYMTFLSFLDYTPGLSAEEKEELVRQMASARSRPDTAKTHNGTTDLDMDSNSRLHNGELSDALVTCKYSKSSRDTSGLPLPVDVSTLPKAAVYQLSTLFSSTPPADLPPYPGVSNEIALRGKTSDPHRDSTATDSLLANIDCHEAVTYHPLLTDVLNSILLCHSLMQTSNKELQRHAYMAARLVRLADGYPVLQPPRSPSRSDWIEILRRTDNHIDLSTSWENLCARAPAPGHESKSQQKEGPARKEKRLKQQAIMEALEDDRVHDEESFHAAVAARQRRQEDDEAEEEEEEARKTSVVKEGSKRSVPFRDGDYVISNERAHAITRWILEAPTGGKGVKKKRKKKRGVIE